MTFDNPKRTYNMILNSMCEQNSFKSQALLKTQHFLSLNCVLVYWGCCQRTKSISASLMDLALYDCWTLGEKKNESIKRLILFDNFFNFIYHWSFRLLKIDLPLTLLTAVLSHLKMTSHYLCLAILQYKYRTTWKKKVNTKMQGTSHQMWIFNNIEKVNWKVVLDVLIPRYCYEKFSLLE